MNTTHNIQLGISVDDDSIVKSVIEAARKSIERGLFNEEITHNRWGRYEFSREFRNGCIDPLLEEMFNDEAMRNLIAKYAAEILSERLVRSGKFKDKVIGKIK